MGGKKRRNISAFRAGLVNESSRTPFFEPFESFKLVSKLPRNPIPTESYNGEDVIRSGTEQTIVLFLFFVFVFNAKTAALVSSRRSNTI